MATHSSVLAWEIPWTEEPGGLQFMWLQKIWTQFSDQTTKNIDNLIVFFPYLQYNFIPSFLNIYLKTYSKWLHVILSHEPYFLKTLLNILVTHKYIHLCICCSSVIQSCLTFCDPMDCCTPGFPVLHNLLEFAQTHVQSWNLLKIMWVVPSSHLILCCPSCHQSFPASGFFFFFFPMSSSLQQVAKLLEL